jgi:hypothetical protein
VSPKRLSEPLTALEGCQIRCGCIGNLGNVAKIANMCALAGAAPEASMRFPMG